ncbi:MAG TPA: PHP domain-containing protein [Candidatus Hypogeohydataceae bacterium YC38]
MNFTTDCHVHTRWSACADPIDLEDYINLAQERGIGRFAITDHSNDIYFDKEEGDKIKWHADPSSLKEALKRHDNRMRKYISYLERYRDKGVRVGIELEQMPSGEFIFDWGLRDRFDLVIGAVHSLPSRKRGASIEEIQEEFLSLTLKALEHDIDILAHPTRGLRRPGIPIPLQYYDTIIDKATSRGIALELNSHSLDPDPGFLQRCIERGGKIALSTDSHSLKEFGDFSFHKRLFEAAGLNGKDLGKWIFTLK